MDPAHPVQALVDEAPEDDLPPLLVAPPWIGTPEPAVVKGLKRPADEPVLTWRPGERDEWLRRPWEREYKVLEPLPQDSDWAALAEPLFAGAGPSKDYRGRGLAMVGLILQAPDDIALRILRDGVPKDSKGRPTDTYELAVAQEAIIARHGLTALPLLLALAKVGHNGMDGLVPVLHADVAQLMVNGLGDHYKGDAAHAWFVRHGTAAARLIIPDALRAPGPKRTKAEAALRLVAEHHGDEAVAEAARHYGEEAVAALGGVSGDALHDHPRVLPDVGPCGDPARLPQILLRGRERALPPSATRHFVTMLSICTPADLWGEGGHAYAGVDLVVPLLDPASLAEFAWALYRLDDGPGWASRWVAFALGRLGDDETARRLAPIVMDWSKATAYSVGGTAALRVFIDIGTDAALRELHRISLKARDVKRIRPFADGALQRAARKRGLTTGQLADRLVSDLGLDADGGMTLDYGPRRFTVGFDEQLKPYVTDGSGRLRKTLPKPAAGDDPVLAPAAHARFTALKKQARTLASDQIARLERAMVSGRGWTPDEFRTLLIGHPLIRHIARRLVWSAGGTAFRVAEDRTLADVHDETYDLPGTARVALPYPSLLGDELAAWARLFADYEIVQPFPQLGRTVHTLTDDERKARTLDRFAGATSHYGRFLGMTRRGWRIGDKETGGYQRTIRRDLDGERRVVVSLDPGIRVLTPDDDPIQRVEEVRLLRGGAFGDVDPVLMSELIAELEALA